MTTHPAASGPPRRPPALSALLAVLTVLAMVGSLLVLAPAPRVRAAPTQEGSPIEVELDAVAPAVATPGTQLVVTGTIRNLTEQPVPVDTVRLSTAYRGLDTPAAVTDWSEGQLGETVATPIVIGEDRIGSDLAPGAVVSFRAVVDEEAVAPPFEFATLPLRIEALANPDEGEPVAAAQQVLGGLRSYLPWDGESGYEYHPIEVSWLVPVTPPPTPDLLSADPATRDAAWNAAAGPDSASRRLLTELAGTAITFFVDPALLFPPEPVSTLVRPEETEPPEDTEGPDDTEGPEETETATGTQTPSAPEAPGATEGPGTEQPPSDGEVTAPTATPPPGDDAMNTGVPGADPGGTPTTPSSPTIPELPGDAVEEVGAVGHAAGLRRALGQVDPERLWWLPVGDVDIAALADLGLTPEEIAEFSGRRALPVEDADDTDGSAGDEAGTTEDEAPGTGDGTEDTSGDDDATATGGSGTSGSGTGGSEGGTGADGPFDDQGGTTEGRLAGDPVELLGGGRHDIAWPALDTVTEQVIATLSAVWVFHAAGSGSLPETAPLAGTVLPGGSIDTDTTLLGNAVRRHADGTLLLAYDERLSAMVTGVEAAEGSGGVSQRLVAELLALYQEQPAEDRSLLIVLPRQHGVSPEALADLYRATADLPWAQAVPLHDLMDDAPADSEPVTLQSATGDEDDGADDPAYPTTPPSPLTAARLDLVESARDNLTGVGEVVPDGVAGARTWDPVLDQLVSVRWRYQDAAWAEPLTAAQQVSEEIVNGIHVNPTTINFLADEGLIQITVVNDLPVTVSDLTMTLSPRNPRLRIVEQPEPIEIGPSSRATVQFRARSLAAGEVEVETQLSTPNGTPLADQQLMRVNVRPTGVWIYWVLGGAAGIILVLGLWRALRPQRSGTQGAATPQTTEGDGDGPDTRTTEL